MVIVIDARQRATHIPIYYIACSNLCGRSAFENHAVLEHVLRERYT